MSHSKHLPSERNLESANSCDNNPVPSQNDSKRQHLASNLHYGLLFILSIPYLLIAFKSVSTQYLTSISASDTNTLGNVPFHWENVIPTPELLWHNCFPNRQCARLAVPLDYNNLDGEQAAIALIRIKAKFPPISAEYRGPILFNPGGPGGAGVAMVDKMGEHFQKILGDEYDIIGFDPRGVGLTTPAVSIFPDPYERAYWDAGVPSIMNSTPSSFLHAYTRSKVFGDLAIKRTQHAAQHVGTAAVARDLLTITQAHGRNKLLYWGFSYGSVLGATYAALFPDNIERLVIDGVVDFDDYYFGNWSKNLKDTDTVLQQFYHDSVQRKVENILISLKTSPFPVLDDTGSSYAVLDYSMVKNDLFRALYNPFTALTQYAHVLAALEQGDARLALEYWQKYHPKPRCNTEPENALPSGSTDAGVAIACGEGEGAGRGFEDITRQFEALNEVSMFADVWVDLTRTVCAGWKIKVKDRYRGHFNTTTSFPMLIIGNTADTVTPLAGAEKAARGFKGSSLLTINTPGHCSLAATSPSAMAHIRRYFREGLIPPEGTVCEVEDTFFDSPTQHQAFHIATPQDQDIIHATRLLSRQFQQFRSRDGSLL